MKFPKEMHLRFTNRLLLMTAFVFLLALVSGCQSVGGGLLPAKEFADFTAKSQEDRIMQKVSLRWEIRDDVAEYCARSIGMGREQAYFTPPLACAVWHVKRKECVIVTGKVTSHVALGHEVRHCFEGHHHQ